MLNKLLLKLFFFLFLFFGLESCGIDKAKEADKQQVVIVSDFLNKKDESLFQSFEKENGIKVVILHLHSDTILKRFETKGYASGIDIILLRSAIDMCQFTNKGYLQRVYDPTMIPEIPNRYCDSNNRWFGIAIDPYIILTSPRDSSGRITKYRDLAKKDQWMSNIKDDHEWQAFVCGSFHKMNGDKDSVKEKWMSSVFDKQINYFKVGDSAWVYPPLLTKYSSFYSDSSLFKSSYKRARLVFPNQTEGGTLYELRAVGIVRQASNYTNATQFLKYITASANNQRVNSWWNTYPVITTMERSYTYQNVRFKKYPVPVRNLCGELPFAERSIQQMRKK